MHALVPFALLIQAPLTAEIVTNNVAKALNVSALHQQGLMLTGKSHANGIDGGYSLLFTPTGEYLETISGELPATSGFDGKVAWEADASGATRILALEDRDQSLSITWLISGQWLAKDKRFDVKLDKSAGDDPVLFVVQKSGLFEADITVDSKTWLPKKIAFEDGAGPAEITLTDYKQAEGFKFPGNVSISQGGMTNTYTIEQGQRAPTFVRNPYAMPEWKPAADTKHDPAKPVEVQLTRTWTGHLLVKPLINGQDVGSFILDSGAGSMCIDTKAADKLNLKKIGKVPVVGIGGIVEGSFRRANDFELGQVSIKNLNFVQLDLEQLSKIFRTEIAGIVGYDFFRRAVVGLELKNNKLFVSGSPSGVPATAWQELILDGNHPIIRARFEKVPQGAYRLDTGAQGAVTIMGPLVEKHKLLDGRKTSKTRLGGVGGGFTEAEVGKLEWFELAGHRFEGPTVTFAKGNRGPLASKYLDGNIGQDFLLPFRIVFDYDNRRIAFVPLKD